jgi:hypothetical protein
MNVADTDHVTAIARVAGSQQKKRPAAEGLEGQGSLFDEKDAEVAAAGRANEAVDNVDIDENDDYDDLMDDLEDEE